MIINDYYLLHTYDPRIGDETPIVQVFEQRLDKDGTWEVADLVETHRCTDGGYH